MSSSDSTGGGRWLATLVLAAVIYALNSRGVPVHTIFVLGLILGVLVGAAWVGFQLFLLTPFKIRRNQRLNTDPQFDRIDPETDHMPDAIRSAFHRADEELDRLGFAPVAAFRSTNMMANSEVYVAMYRNLPTREVARFVGTIVRTEPPAQAATKVSTQTHLETEYGDGTAVLTSDTRTPPVYPRMAPPIHPFAFPQVEEMAQLVAIHRGLTRRFDAGRTRQDPIGSDPLAHLRRLERRGQEWFQAIGYHEPVEDGTALRPTLKGAMLMTWRFLPPWKQIRGWNRLRRAERILRELRAEGALA